MSVAPYSTTDVIYMVLGRFRGRYQEIMAPVGRTLGRLGLTPNLITILSVIVSIGACWMLYLQELLWGAALIILTGVVDMFDGAVARAMGTASPAGATFDHVMDRYAEFFMVLGLILSQYVTWWIGFFAFFSMVMASFTRAKAESVGGLKDCTVGLAERQEKLGIILFGLFTTFLIPSINLLGISLLEICLATVGILSQITVIQRISYTFKMQGGPAK